MKITDASVNQAATGGAGAGGVANGVGRTGGTAPSSGTSAKVPSAAPALTGDDVQLSDLGSRIQALGQVDSPERAAKVARIAAAVKSGSYQVDTKQVSKSLVDDALRFSSGNK